MSWCVAGGSTSLGSKSYGYRPRAASGSTKQPHGPVYRAPAIPSYAFHTMIKHASEPGAKMSPSFLKLLSVSHLVTPIIKVSEGCCSPAQSYPPGLTPLFSKKGATENMVVSSILGEDMGGAMLADAI